MEKSTKLHFTFHNVLFPIYYVGNKLLNMNSKEALNKLLEGNQRFIQGTMGCKNSSIEQLREMANNHKPFAVVIGCSDSRVVPEIIFDQGLGELFVVRVAGNTVDNVCIGSVEYAVEHLNIPLVLVLGHTECGVFKTATSGDDVHHHLGSLVETAKKAVERIKDFEGCSLSNAIKENIHILVDKLQYSSPTIDKFIKEGKVEIRGALYDIKTGKIGVLH